MVRFALVSLALAACTFAAPKSLNAKPECPPIDKDSWNWQHVGEGGGDNWIGEQCYSPADCGAGCCNPESEKGYPVCHLPSTVDFCDWSCL